MTDDEIACPDCAETIKAAAKVCRFCGYRLVPVADATPSPAVTASHEQLSGEPSNRPAFASYTGKAASWDKPPPGQKSRPYQTSVWDRALEGDGKGWLLIGGGFLISVAALGAIANSAFDKPAPLPTPSIAPMAVAPDDARSALPILTPIYTAAQRSMICRAGIAAEFGRSHKIMKAKALSDGLVRISYRRPDDQKLWKSDCKVEGQRIVWRTVDAFPGSGPGRWRTGEYDDVLTFTLKGDAVTTSSSDGSSASETYRF